MVSLCGEIKPLLEGARFVDIVEETPRHFYLHFKKGQTHHYLLICLQEPFLRFHLSHEASSNNSSPFLNALNHALKTQVLQTIDLLQEDRILQLKFPEQILIAEFFSRRPNLFLTDHNNSILSALNPTSLVEYASPASSPACASKSIPSPISSKEVEEIYQKRELEWAFQTEKEELKKVLLRLIKRTTLHIQNQYETLQKCLSWEKVNQQGVLLKSFFHLIKKGMKEIVVEDWESNQQVAIPLNPDLTSAENVAALFRTSKKLYAGIPHQEREWEKAKQKLISYQQELEQLEAITTKKGLEPFKKELTPPKKTALEKLERKPYREFISAAGLKIWVGRDASHNEKLTFSLARGSDWWLHAHQVPGSHVVLRMDKKQAEPDSESLQDAIQLALAYSKAKAEGEVCITQCKYVSRFGKGQKGKVHVSKHQLVYAKKDPERLRLLRERSLL